MNWMLVLAPHDHPGGQDRPGAIPGAPSPGAPCAVRVPELGALGRGRGKEGKGRGRNWMPVQVPGAILAPQGRLGANPGALGLGQAPRTARVY